MTIHDVKNDPILQVSSQEPSTSSKYDFEDGRFLAHHEGYLQSKKWRKQTPAEIKF